MYTVSRIKAQEITIMKWNRQEYIDLLTGKCTERQMFCELFGPLIGLEDEWRAQGATEKEISMLGFDFDYVPNFFVTSIKPINTFEPVTLEENDEYFIGKDELGRTVKLCKSTATIPLPLDYPVKDMESWLKIKHMYEFSPERIDWEQIEKAKQLQKEGVLIVAEIPGGFDTPRELMGEEVACLSYYEEPELMEDIIQTISDTAYQVLDVISREVTIDNLFIHEDMAGKSGPLVGPNLVREFISPYYKRIWDLLRSRGTQLFSQDSDGNIEPVMDAFIEAGVNIFYPCEPAAGMDIVALRKKYGPEIHFKGGIDKHILRSSKEDIRKELEYKLQPMMQETGVVFGLDHRIPNGTPLENYRYYVKTARELLGREELSPEREGWARMAF